MSLIPASLPVRGYVVGGALYQTNGSQHSLAELQQLATDLGVCERVGFTGFIDDPDEAMRALDVVVHASTQPEPFGLVIVEGMATGRAVIVSARGGAAELITEGIDALAHSSGDAVSLARCILRLAIDANLRERLGQRARATAERRFDRERLASELIPIYQSVRDEGLENLSHEGSARSQWKYLRRSRNAADHVGALS
jgi:glycosyltransferase involved in cell wall biosynthesis